MKNSILFKRLFLLLVIKQCVCSYISTMCDLAAAFRADVVGVSGWKCVSNVPVQSPCLWYRVYCINASVTSIDLHSLAISGTLPESLGALTSLTSLRLDKNYFYQTIPSALSLLSSMKYLNLGDNYFKGAIPTAIGTLENLSYLNLEDNFLVSSIPATLTLLQKVTYMSLGFNSFMGSIPPLGDLTSLRYLDLQSNLLNGSIASLFSSQETSPLQTFKLNENSFSGSLPSSLGISLPALETFQLQKNHFTFTLPTSLGLLTNLNILDLSANKFQGKITSGLKQLSRLKELYLYSNSFTGSVPSSLCSNPKLSTLPLFPEDAGDLATGFTCYASCLSSVPSRAYTQPYGTLQPCNDSHWNASDPLFLSEFEALCDISTSLNPATKGLRGWRCSSSIPHHPIVTPCAGDGAVWAGLTCDNDSHVLGLDLSGLNLKGTLPSSISKLVKLETLKLNNNLLSRSVPSAVFRLHSLKTLSLYNNLFNGSLSIPDCTTDSSPAVSLASMTGEDPTRTSLTSLSSSSSLASLTGSGSGSSLRELVLYQNMLSGTISTCFCSLTTLSRLVLFFDSGAAAKNNNSRLFGCVPSCLEYVPNTGFKGAYGSLDCSRGGSDGQTEGLRGARLGGVIAGVVIGFLIIAVIGFLLFRRNNRLSVQSGSSEVTDFNGISLVGLKGSNQVRVSNAGNRVVFKTPSQVVKTTGKTLIEEVKTRKSAKETSTIHI